MLKTGRRRDLERIAARMSQVLDDFRHRVFKDEYCPIDHWSPAINAYLLPGRVEVCVDLAGVARDEIDVTIQQGALVIRGTRRAPEPERGGGEGVRVIGMEIDYGPFCRRLRLPEEVDVDKVEARRDDGLLWISMPLRPSA
jgi:HSP20 family protein